METRANNILVGSFVLIGFALCLAMAVWIARTGNQGLKKQFYVVFTGSVQGLNVGGAVLYQGLRVGEIEEIRINPGNTTEIRARISVDDLTPVRRDTRVRLSSSLLTGVSTVEFSGGNEGSGELLPGPDGVPPAIFAERSFVQNILEGGQDTLTRVNSVVQRLDDIVRENQEGVNGTIANLRSFSDALASNNQAVASLVSDASIAARRVADVAARLETIVAAIEPTRVRETVDGVAAIVTVIAEQREQIGQAIGDVSRAARNVADTAERLGPTVARVDSIIAAVEPERVRSAVEGLDRSVQNFARITDAVDAEQVRRTVQNVADISDTVTAERQRIADTIGDVSRAARSIAETAERLGPTVARVDSIIAAVEPERVRSTVEGLDRSVQNFARITDAVDAEQVRRTVQNVADISDTVAAERQRIADTIGDVSRAARSIAETAERLGPTVARVDSIIAAVEPERVRSAVDGLDRAAQNFARVGEAIDGEQVRRTVANIADITDTLSAERQRIAGTVQDVGRAARNIAEATDRLSPVVRRVDDILSAVDPGAVGRSVSSVERFTGALGQQSERVGDIVQQGQELVASLRRSAASIEQFTSSTAENPDGGVIGEVSRTARAIRTVAENIDRRVTVIAPGLARFSDAGLRDLQNLIADGRRTLVNLDRLFRSVETNPQQFIFGRPGVPETRR